MEGAGLMRNKQINVVMLVLFAALGIEIRAVRAQTTPQPPIPSATIPLEMIGDPGGRGLPPSPASAAASRTPGGVPSPYPTPQGSNYRGPGVNAGLSQLRNPFDGGQGQEPIHRHSEPSTGPASPVYPSPQGPNDYGMGGNTMLGQLRNPFGAWHGGEKKGLLEYVGPEYGPGAGVPGAPGGAMGPGAGAGATTPGAGTTGTTPPAAGDTAGTGAGAPGAEAPTGPGYGGALEAAVTPFAMIGDMSPISIEALKTNAKIPGPPAPPSNRGGSPIYAAARNLKVSDNQSPRPQDRIYFNFNYYNGVDNTINRRDLSPVTQMKVYQYLFGIEKTFNDGKGSIGFRVPLDTLTANSSPAGAISTPTSTSAGNLSVIGKYIIEQNKQTGSLLSVGLAITTPTGPSKFAGAPYLFPLNSVYFQPYIGYIYNHNRWYVQGFSGFNFTSNVNDVSYIFNDVAVGYYLFRDDNPQALLSAVAPTFELHVNNPINHRDVFNRSDLAGMPDSVDLTFGLNVQFRHNAVLTFAYVAPVASPRPFDSEALMMLNIFYGRTRAGLTPITPPPAL
jgi:hypothetical protein